MTDVIPEDVVAAVARKIAQDLWRAEPKRIEYDAARSAIAALLDYRRPCTVCAGGPTVSGIPCPACGGKGNLGAVVRLVEGDR